MTNEQIIRDLNLRINKVKALINRRISAYAAGGSYPAIDDLESELVRLTLKRDEIEETAEIAEIN